MTESKGDCSVGNIKVGSDCRPCVACPIGRETGEQRSIDFTTTTTNSLHRSNVFEGDVETFEVVGVRLEAVKHVEKMRAIATETVYEFGSLGLNFNGVEAASLGTMIFYATINDRGEVAEVNAVYTAQAKDEFESVNILLDIRLNGGIEQQTQLLNGKGAFGCSNGANFETAERIGRRYLIVKSIIEHSTDIAQMNVASIGGGSSSSEIVVESREPVFGYVIKAECINFIGGEAANTRECVEIHFTRGVVFGVGEAEEASHKEIFIGSILGRSERSQNAIFDGGGRERSSLTGLDQREHCEVHVRFETRDESVEPLALGVIDDVEGAFIPLRREQRDTGGNVGGGVAFVDCDFQRSRKARTDSTSVEIKICSSHNIKSETSARFLQDFFSTKQPKCAKMCSYSLFFNVRAHVREGFSAAPKRRRY